ncbi:MAG: Asp-tRNA(Asn)/Glu-tRNA(Gln) amidotransferase subunit GatC [Cytophagales bacterium]|nr:MAG: Asp-tRNA(Asn)/Glu-tRNA(Gln) amidotransferase subunit GatC [Cytophagales bacterium]TAF60079.1 MAG: Asp-tRNA(Asn)/Glu-tRNA(Gln) amidotransferase subunit GatC [Cytophagales bacterium]
MSVKINSELLKNLAHLSRLEFSSEEEGKMLTDMNTILSWIQKLEEIDTDGVAPLIHLSESHNILRADEVKNQLSRAKALKNAPQKDSNYFRVPKVLE